MNVRLIASAALIGAVLAGLGSAEAMPAASLGTSPTLAGAAPFIEKTVVIVKKRVVVRRPRVVVTKKVIR